MTARKTWTCAHRRLADIAEDLDRVYTVPGSRSVNQKPARCPAASSRCSRSGGVMARPRLLLLDEPSLGSPRSW